MNTSILVDAHFQLLLIILTSKKEHWNEKKRAYIWLMGKYLTFYQLPYLEKCLPYFITWKLSSQQSTNSGLIGQTQRVIEETIDLPARQLGHTSIGRWIDPSSIRDRWEDDISRGLKMKLPCTCCSSGIQCKFIFFSIRR